MRFSAVILAGGKSTRMGRDKAWIEYRGRPLIQRQIQRGARMGAVEVFVSAAPNEKFESLDVPILPDRFVEQGPLAGIERGLHAARSPLVLVLAVDLPRMSLTTLRWLAGKCGASVGIVPRVNGDAEPLAAFYPKRAHGIAARLLAEGQNSVWSFAQACCDRELTTWIDVPRTHQGAFLNWNRPLDVRR